MLGYCNANPPSRWKPAPWASAPRSVRIVLSLIRNNRCHLTVAMSRRRRSVATEGNEPRSGSAVGLQAVLGGNEQQSGSGSN